MKTIDLAEEKPNIESIIDLASREPVLLVTSDGKEFFVSPADDFEREVEMLRASSSFQAFLDARSKYKRTVSLDEVERRIDEELERDRVDEGA